MSIKLNIEETVFNSKKGKVLIETNGNTVGENLNYGFKQIPELEKAIFEGNGDLGSGILIKINGQFLQSNQLTASVKEGDTIEVMKYDG